jgi:hypothetical protein
LFGLVTERDDEQSVKWIEHSRQLITGVLKVRYLVSSVILLSTPQVPKKSTVDNSSEQEYRAFPRSSALNIDGRCGELEKELSRRRDC